MRTENDNLIIDLDKLDDSKPKVYGREVVKYSTGTIVLGGVNDGNILNKRVHFPSNAIRHIDQAVFSFLEEGPDYGIIDFKHIAVVD